MKKQAQEEGLAVLRAVLQRMRNEKQDGYTDCKNGKFSGTARFISCGLPQATPEELDALFALAGIVPDAIESNGSCSTCVYGDARGGNQGWDAPCCSCAHPKMTNFVALASVKDSALRLTDIEATMLDNAKERVWWATDIALPGDYAKLEECHRVRAQLVKRDLISSERGSMGGLGRLTNKGRRALARHAKRAA